MIEISLFIRVGEVIGVWSTIGLTILTAVIGASLVRNQGIQTLLSAQTRLQQGEVPTLELIEGIMLIFAGVFLITPGFMTDFFGIILLLPIARKFIAQRLEKRIQSVSARKQQFDDFHYRHTQSAKNDEGNVFEGEFERKDDDNDRNRLN